jgi:hypothetical protein
MSANSSLRNTYGVLLLVLLFFVLPMLSIEAEAQSQQPIFPVTVFSPGVSAMASGDFNGDGQTDLASLTYVPNANPKNPTVIVLLNQGLTGNPISVSTNLSGCTPQSQLVTADMNNDKKLDLVFSCAEDMSLSCLVTETAAFRHHRFMPSRAHITSLRLISTVMAIWTWSSQPNPTRLRPPWQFYSTRAAVRRVSLQIQKATPERARDRSELATSMATESRTSLQVPHRS